MRAKEDDLRQSNPKLTKELAMFDFELEVLIVIRRGSVELIDQLIEKLQCYTALFADVYTEDEIKRAIVYRNLLIRCLENVR